MTLDVSPVVDSSTLNAVVRPWWSIWAAIRWGFRQHSCVLWCCAGRVPADVARAALGIETFHPVDVAVFYRELLVQLVPEKELAQMMVDAMSDNERRHLKKTGRIYGGKQMFEAGEGRRTIGQLMNEVFVPNFLPRIRESDDSEETRITDVRLFAEGLRRTVSMRSEEPPMDRTKLPLLLISEECPNLIETIPSLESDRDKRPEDAKLVGNEQDSIWDAARMCFREYPNVIGSLPHAVKRAMAIAKGTTPQQRYLNAIEFDYRNNRTRLTRRR